MGVLELWIPYFCTFVHFTTLAKTSRESEERERPFLLVSCTVDCLSPVSCSKKIREILPCLNPDGNDKVKAALLEG